MGRVDYGQKSSERGNAILRRSLNLVRHLARGERITPDAVRSVRPGIGAAPKHLEAILGRPVLCDIAANTPVRLEDIG